MILSSKFDVLRGGLREGSIDESFPVKVTAGVPVTLIPGTVVQLQPDGTVDKATTPNMTNADAKAPWLVVEGNDDYSAKFVGKVVCLRNNVVVRLDPANFVPGTYPPTTPVSFDAGRFKVAAATNQIIGEVISNDTALDGTITVYFHGGAIAKV